MEVTSDPHLTLSGLPAGIGGLLHPKSALCSGFPNFTKFNFPRFSRITRFFCIDSLKSGAIESRFKIQFEHRIAQTAGNRAESKLPASRKIRLFPYCFPLGDIMVLIVRNSRAFCALFSPVSGLQALAAPSRTAGSRRRIRPSDRRSNRRRGALSETVCFPT